MMRNEYLPSSGFIQRQAKEMGISNRYMLANRSDCYSQAYSSSGVRTGTCLFPSKVCAFIDEALANLTFTPYLKREKINLGISCSVLNLCSVLCFFIFIMKGLG